jgi:TM2 domain-containing membrane protein YozV
MMKKKWLALLGSFILPGVGHFYVGQPKKGAILLAIYIASVLLTAFLIGFIPLVIVWIYSMVDSYRQVAFVNSEYNGNFVR